MQQSLRITFPWCWTGAALGAFGGLALAAIAQFRLAGSAAAILGFSALGLAFGFTLATFVHGIRQIGMRAIAKAALNYAMLSLIFAPLLHLAGWSERALLEDILGGAVFLAVTGAYIKSADIWLPNVAGQHPIA